MKIAVTGLFHETNSFAPGMTEVNDFSGEWVSGNDYFLQRYEHTRTSMGGVIDAAHAEQAQLECGLYVAATPSGMVSKEAVERLLDEVVASVDVGADGIVLILHGAMMAEGVPDVEGELLRRIRSIVPGKPIVATLDLHANVSQEMVQYADVLVGYDTYPHIDAYERAVEAVQLLCRIIRGEASPTMALAQPRMVLVPHVMLTDADGPMLEIMERAFAIERDPAVMNVTVCGGFAYSDTPDAGVSVIVTTNNNVALADRYAAELSGMFRERRERLQHHGVPAAEAVAMAFAEELHPVILVESSDNVGGGSPADATHVLKHLVGAPNKSLIVIRDAEAARLAHRLGVGAAFDAEIGGKSDTLHGDPVRIQGRIKLLSDGKYAHIGSYMTGQLADMGHTAVIEAGNLTVILTEHRTAPWDPGHVTSVGLRAEDFHVIVVKAAVAWRTSFGSIAQRIIGVDTPGCCGENLTHLPYRAIRRPIFPLDSIQDGGTF
jgi:microcystin degradation protein MlrC